MYRLQVLANRGLISGAVDQCAVLRRAPEKWRCGLARYSTAEATAASAAAALGKTKPRDKILSMENLNPQVKAVEYAVRGPIVIKAAEIERIIQQVRRAPALPVYLGSLPPPYPYNKKL